MAISQTIPETCPRCSAQLDDQVIRDRPAARWLKAGAGAVLVACTAGLLGIASAAGSFADGIKPAYVVAAICVSVIPAGILYRMGAGMKKIKQVSCRACRWKGRYALPTNETIRLMVDA